MFSRSLRPGEHLGGYQILSRLGAGGMGEVYLAEDSRLGRRVAVKVLLPELALDSSAMKRFEREACAASALNHPSILTIHELGRDGDVAYIVGEYVDGVTLRARLADGPLPLREVVNIGTQTSSALAVAHAAGIVHRDLKPENVMLRRDGLVKVLDFGLAKQLPQRAAEADAATIEQTTEAGTVLGTIDYMSPEQVRGRPVDARSDIFSLGTMLYELAAGQVPFTGETWSHVMVAILEQEAPPLDDPGLQPIVAKALQKDPADRYQTTGELLADLQALDVDESRPRFRLGRRARIALASAAAIAALVFALSFVTREHAPRPPLPIAVADFDNQTGEKALDGLSGMLITSLEQSRRLSVMTRSRMFDSLRRSGRNDVARIDEAIGREVARSENLRGLVTASVSKLGTLYVIDMKMIDPATNRYVFAGKAEARGQERIPKLIDGLSERLRLSVKETKTDVRAAAKEVGAATTTNLEAYSHYFRGDELVGQLKFREAIVELKKAVEMDPAFGLAWTRMAYAAKYIREDEEARRYIANARRFSEGAAEKELLTIAAIEADLAGKHREATALWQRLLEQYPGDKEALFAIGDVAFHQGDFGTAREYFRRTLQVDPNNIRALEHLVQTGLSSGDSAVLPDAERFAKQAPSVSSLTQLSQLYFLAGRDAEGLAMAQQAVNRYPQESDFGAIRPYVIALLHTGDREGARRTAKRLLEYPDPANPGRYEVSLAAVAVDEGRFREALDRLQKAGNMAIAGNSRAHASRFADRALLLALSGRAPEARAVITSLLDSQTELPNVLGVTFATAIFVDDLDTARSLQAKMQPLDADLSRPMLSAAEARRRGNPGAAVDALRHRPIDRLYDWYAAWCALEAGRLDEAEASTKRLYGGAHAYFSIAITEHLLGRIEEARGNRAAAKKHYEKVLERWRNADPDLPQLIDTKARLAKL